jgi:hypothetical protein
MLSINNTTTKSLTNVGGPQKLTLETAKPNVEKAKTKQCAVWDADNIQNAKDGDVIYKNGEYWYYKAGENRAHYIRISEKTAKNFAEDDRGDYAVDDDNNFYKRD